MGEQKYAAGFVAADPSRDFRDGSGTFLLEHVTRC
jgi:hypothetical protein